MFIVPLFTIAALSMVLTCWKVSSLARRVAPKGNHWRYLFSFVILWFEPVVNPVQSLCWSFGVLVLLHGAYCSLTMSGYCYGKRIWKEASCWCYPSTWNWCYLWGHWSFRKCQRYSEGVSDASFAKTWTFQPRTTYEGRHSLYFKILASLSWQASMDVFIIMTILHYFSILLDWIRQSNSC